MTSRFRQIVETAIKNITEDAFSDRDRYKDAIDVYLKVLNTMEPYLNTDKVITDTAEGVNLQVDTPYGPLMVSVSLDKDVHNSGAYYPEYNAIELNIHDIVDLSDETINMTDPITGEKNVTGINAKYLYKILSSRNVQDTFIHEYTHFIDDKTKYSMKKQADIYKNSDYFNKPYERNAFYIAWLNKIVSHTYNKYGKIMKDLTPEERLNFLRNAWKEDEEFVEYYNKLEPAAKKRFMSRLYNYFSTDFWSDAA